MRCLKYQVNNQFKDFLPDPGDFELIHENIPPIKQGEFLVKAKFISTDPYLRSFANRSSVPYEQFGFQVGRVVESKHPDYPATMNVVSHSGWRDYTVLNGDPDEIFNIKPYNAPVGNLPLSYAVGALGMPGMTAYLGLLEICRPEAGEVVCVSSAAGAVGSLVGQIAKLQGCTVIGFAGTDAKVDMLRNELKFDHAFNYKATKDVKGAIRSVTHGIDCYFDNVGGTLSAQVMECMNENGRVAVCGSISLYGKNSSPRKKPHLPASVTGVSFSFTQWNLEQQGAALAQLKTWIEQGKIQAKETIVKGFEGLPNTFIGMLRGDYVGKTVVKV
ncbi:unnamed protein product [Chrysodeixis includens]|uniref:15-oxoprostaglandin 13-reductase n=1 Tax=Chrysodeixis includens TaxID=689277 RepID=A0A9P0BRL7_CHRIL|nr:unnamed protein product [Chrysodeixis includens]